MKSGGGRPDAYRNAAGDKLPSVTTVTGRAKDSGGLIYVAKKRWHEAGRKGLPFDADAYWQETDALQVGSVVHTWIEDHIHGRELTPYPDMPVSFLDDAQTGFGAYRKWWEQTNLKVIATEVPLVSEAEQFGGTLDAIAEIGDEAVLLDWKSSNATYVDYIAQLAAYRHLIDANYPEYPLVNEAYLLRVGKAYGDFHLHHYPQNVLDMGWKWFLAAKQLYDYDAKLKKVAT